MTLDARKTHRRSLLLVGGAVILGLIFAGILLLLSREGATVRIKVDGKIIADIPLSADTEYMIEGADGGSNLLVIHDGYAEITEADCADSLCVKMGRINTKGQSIICLPHKVVVEVIGDDSTDEGGSEDPDVIVY